MDHSLTRRTLLAATAGSLAMAGCVGGDSETDDGGDSMNDDGSDSMDDGSSDSTGGSDDGGSRPAWQTVTLTDATTGEEFTIAEIDKPVVLHTFATWCSKCKSQQNRLSELHESRGDEIVLVDLSIEQNDDPADIKAHAEENGFGWRFGVSPAEMTSSLVDDFDQSVTIAPQSPVIVVCPDGATTRLSKGVGTNGITDAIDENC